MLEFRDEDDGKVLLHYESDYELAIETARESAKDRHRGQSGALMRDEVDVVLVKGVFFELCGVPLVFPVVYNCVLIRNVY